MSGFQVKQVFPTLSLPQIDPFLPLHHVKIKPLYSCPTKNQGIGPHPHWGFSLVSFVIAGGIDHRDSRGNSLIEKVVEVQGYVLESNFYVPECKIYLNLYSLNHG